ncbi:hypothetical protein C2E23DRAFT_857101 [Lenzites betulinus]|nr:hypothetical protein C2E23DRAFT_857101 [Lenzites betulinus]
MPKSKNSDKLLRVALQGSATSADPYPPPSTRRKQKSSLQTAERNKVDKKAKEIEPEADSPFCVVTHAPDRYTIIEYAHLVPAAVAHQEDKAKLEWAWDLRVGTCDKTYLNAPDNIHPLDVTLHRYFDRTENNTHNGWFWLPCGNGAFDIIANMREYYVGTRMGSPEQYPNARRNPFEFYPDSEDNKPFEFKYQLVPFPAMKTSWAVRRLDFPVAEFSPATKFEQYYYPFETVPHMVLHVPYHSVIYDTGRKLSGAYTIPHLVDSMLKQDFGRLGAITLIVLQSMKDIYEAWNASKPDWLKKAFSDTQPTSGGPNDSSSLGSGGSSGHGSDAGGSDQNPSAQDGAHSQGGFGQGAGHAQFARRAGIHSSSLAPEDSASCVDNPEDFEDAYEEETQPEDEDSDEEYEDPEWLARLQAWMKEVYEATHERPGSPSSSQATTMVEAPVAPAKAVEARAAEKAAPSIIGRRTESPYIAPCVV